MRSCPLRNRQLAFLMRPVCGSIAPGSPMPMVKALSIACRISLTRSVMAARKSPYPVVGVAIRLRSRLTPWPSSS
ncbi:hypothetical protein D3C80_1972530 [compost metagenome]